MVELGGLGAEAVRHLDELAREKEKTRSQVLEDLLTDDMERAPIKPAQRSNVVRMNPVSNKKKAGTKPA